jgi:hypothetical protein
VSIQPVEPVAMPAMSSAQTASWLGLMALHQQLDQGWTLVGGQLVNLHCAERGSFPQRPTDDVDTVVDVRADPHMLETFTRVLLDIGFVPDTSGDGLQHRWRRGQAQIDVLLPDGIGEHAANRKGAGGAATLPTPGGTQALERSEAVPVLVDGHTGAVRRPNLVGALVMKAAAHTAVGDAARGRHRIDSSAWLDSSPPATSAPRSGDRKTGSGCATWWPPAGPTTAPWFSRGRTPHSTDSRSPPRSADTSGDARRSRSAAAYPEPPASA